jgi:hypothetical protein
MPQAQTLHVADEQDADTIAELEPEIEINGEDLERTRTPGQYAEATPFDLSEFDGKRLPAFLDEVADTEGVDGSHDDARLLHREDWLDDPDYGSDYGLLLVWPDETLMFVGSDPTASGPPWFAYTIDPLEPVPAPDTAQEALDRLKPPAVRDVVHEAGFVPQRQGEWWLRPTPIHPTGTTFRPGVQSKPYGASPLGSHVPTEWGMSVSDQQFIQNARAGADLPASVGTVPEVIGWATRQINKDGSDLSWHDVREWAGDILVRGTIRHRDHDHPVEDVGEDWHLAETHELEVYTADDIEGVHLDYYGG